MMMDDMDTFNTRLAVIKELLHELYDPDELAMWLVTRHERLNGRQPVDLLWSEQGYRRLITIVQQVLDGSFI